MDIQTDIIKQGWFCLSDLEVKNGMFAVLGFNLEFN